MKKILSIAIITVVCFSLGCSRLAQRGETFQQVKIVRVIGKTSLEVLYKGNMIVVDLEGVFIPDENKLESEYFSDNKIDPRLRDMIIREYGRAQNFLSTIIAPGDTMFTEKFVNDENSARKVSNVILYSSDMVSINEKLVSEGFAFPKNKSDIKDTRLAFRLHRALQSSVNKRLGLWPIGQYLLSKYNPELQSQSDKDAPKTAEHDNAELTAEK